MDSNDLTTVSTLARTVAGLRRTEPLVQCITNQVVPQITANALLAAGASPAMVDTPEEAADFAAVASGVLVNTGSPTAGQYSAMNEAVRGARAASTPWILDPVACGGLEARTEFDRDIVRRHPSAVRGNPSEIIALAAAFPGGAGSAGSAQSSGGRGVDSTDDVTSALDAARVIAAATGTVVAVSGPRDLIVSSGRVTWLTSGDPLMQRVIGTGCSLGALTAAYLGHARTTAGTGTPVSDHDAVLAAHAHTGAAGILAARTTQRPGSFAVAWLDALDAVGDDPEQLVDLVSVEEVDGVEGAQA